MLAHRGAHPNNHLKPAQACSQHFLKQRSQTGFSKKNSQRRFPENKDSHPSIVPVDVLVQIGILEVRSWVADKWMSYMPGCHCTDECTLKFHGKMVM